MEKKLDATSNVISEAKPEETNDLIMEEKLGINQESKKNLFLMQYQKQNRKHYW